MIGGGAVFFNLKTNKAIINDSNKDLIKTYQVVRDNLESLIILLEELKQKNGRKFYYQTRDKFNELKLKKKITKKDKIELAAQLIYLNKTCFNGLYRINKNEEFNVPIGSYKNPLICPEEDLREISKLLKNVKIISGDFEECLKYAKKNSFVYFDPPYYPLKNKKSFTTYAKGNFLEKEQEQLSKVFNKLDKKGCKVMLSNSDTDFIKGLYKKYPLKKVKATRMINCNGKNRGKINEVVVRNY